MIEHVEIPLFPLNSVLFPGMLLPLHIFENRYKAMLKYCLSESVDFGVVLLKSGQAEGPFMGELFDIGTTAQIKQVDALPSERFNITASGMRRFRILETHHDHFPFLTATIEYLPNLNYDSQDVVKLARRMFPLLQKYLNLFKTAKGERFRFTNLPSDPLTLAYLVGVILPVENHVKQAILSQPDALSLLAMEYELLKHETVVLKIINDTRPIWATSEDLPYYPN